MNAFLSIVGTAESSSEHPIGLAISQNAKEVLESQALGQCTDFEAVPGHGLQCIVSGIGHLTNGERVNLKPAEGLQEGTFEVKISLDSRQKSQSCYHQILQWICCVLK